MKKHASLLDIYLDRPQVHPDLRGTTGRLFEWELLGECTAKTTSRLGFWQAVVFAKNSQPKDHNPFMPPGEAAAFHGAVRREMGGIAHDRLGLYTGIKSPLDYQHKVDGFFILDHRIIVTFDLTVNPHKDCTQGKGLVLVTGEDARLGYTSAASAIALWFAKAQQYDAQKRAEYFRNGGKPYCLRGKPSDAFLEGLT